MSNLAATSLFNECSVEASDTAPTDMGIDYADVARSENNILKWMSYVPEDCISTMIAMAWDVTP
jgi:hypothetical protein